MRCPKLHYIPFRSCVIIKYLNEFNKHKNYRQRFLRGKHIFMKKPLQRYKNIFVKIENIIFGKNRSSFCERKDYHEEVKLKMERMKTLKSKTEP